MSGAWPNLSELLVDDPKVPIALVGAPLAAGSVTPGACDTAPALLRKTLKRIGRYDVEVGRAVFTPANASAATQCLIDYATVEDASGRPAGAPTQNGRGESTR